MIEPYAAADAPVLSRAGSIGNSTQPHLGIGNGLAFVRAFLLKM